MIDVNVEESEYLRLLGYPRGHTLSGRALELATQARGWYAEHGRPWTYSRPINRSALAAFSSPRLRAILDQADADRAVLVAVSAGPEIEEEAQRAWLADKPDEYFFFETFGSAVVERLITMTGAQLCAWAESQSLAVLPHYSPGYPEWDIAEQPALRALAGDALPGPLDVLASGALRPKKSLLAVFGLTPHTDRVRKLTELVPCESCSYASCEYRRAPYHRAIERSPIQRDAAYAVSPKALKRWAAERLSLSPRDDGSIDALFRYDGTTCTNEGRPLAFHYRVKLGPPADGYPIREEQCAPAPGDTGHKFMCRYLDGREQLMSAIAAEKPLIGRRLDEVMSLTDPEAPAGCYCDAASRNHKWRIVLETIHYALSRGTE